MKSTMDELREELKIRVEDTDVSCDWEVTSIAKLSSSAPGAEARSERRRLSIGVIEMM